MSLGPEIKGLNTLMNKLNRLSNVKGKEAVEGASKIVEASIRASASSFSATASQYVGKCDKREYGNGSYYLDVGLKNDKAPFELWKNLYYHNYGYKLKYYGHPTNTYINMHAMWFDNAVSNIEGPTLQKLKSTLRTQIKACLEG